MVLYIGRMNACLHGLLLYMSAWEDTDIKNVNIGVSNVVTGIFNKHRAKYFLTITGHINGYPVAPKVFLYILSQFFWYSYLIDISLARIICLSLMSIIALSFAPESMLTSVITFVLISSLLTVIYSQYIIENSKSRIDRFTINNYIARTDMWYNLLSYRENILSDLSNIAWIVFSKK